jgi:AraC-like DNA-binding protein
MLAPWRIEPHVHDYHELYLVLQGRIDTSLDGRSVAGRKGEWILVPGGLSHANKVQTGELSLAMIRWTGGDDLVSQTPEGYRFDSGGRLRYLFDWMLDMHDPADGEQLAQVESILQTLLHETRRLRNTDPSDLAESVRRHVRRNIERRIVLDDLAEAACLSKYHFLRKFRAQTGRTPMAFVAMVRLEAARNLIRHSQLSLDAIAAQCGFAGQSHMHQVFKRHLGQAPGSFRVEQPGAI